MTRLLFGAPNFLGFNFLVLVCLSVGLWCPSAVLAAGVQSSAEAEVPAVTDSATSPESIAQYPGSANDMASLLGSVTPGSVGACTPPSMNDMGVNNGSGANNSSGNQTAPELGQFLIPGISLGEFYSDNISLAPDSKRRADYATILTPTINGCTVGSRLRASFRYAWQGIHYARSTPHNKYYNHFSGTVISDLYGDHLFLDSDANYGQAVINPSEASSSNNVFTTIGNRTNTLIYSLSPYWEQSLGPLGMATLRYRYGRIIYYDSQLYGSRHWTKAFDLTNPATNLDWTWTLNWSSTRVEYDRIARTQRFDDAYLQLGYQLFYNFQLLAKGGVETNYRPDGSVQLYGSRYGSGGFRLTSTNGSLLVMYGHHYFGPTWTVRSSYRTPSLRFAAGYRESTSDGSLLQASQAATQVLTLLPQNDLQNTLPFVEKRTTGDMTYLMQNATVGLSVYDDWRFYRPKSFGHIHDTGGVISSKWQYDSLTTLNASFKRSRYFDAQTVFTTNYVNLASVSLSRLLQPDVKLLIDLARQSSRSINGGSNYVANSVLLQLSATF